MSSQQQPEDKNFSNILSMVEIFIQDNDRQLLAKIIREVSSQSYELNKKLSDYCLLEFKEKVQQMEITNEFQEGSIRYIILVIAIWRKVLSQLGKANFHTKDELIEYIGIDVFIQIIHTCSITNNYIINNNNNKLNLDILINCLKYVKAILDILLTFKIPFITMNNIFEIHQYLMNFFENVGFLHSNNENNNLENKIDDEKIEKGLEEIMDVYFKILKESFVNFTSIDDITKFILLCKSLYQYGLTDFDDFLNTCIYLLCDITTCKEMVINFIKNNVRKLTNNNSNTNINATNNMASSPLDIIKEMITKTFEMIQTNQQIAKTIRKSLPVLKNIILNFKEILIYEDIILNSLILIKSKLFQLIGKTDDSKIESYLRSCDEIFLEMLSSNNNLSIDQLVEKSLKITMNNTVPSPNTNSFGNNKNLTSINDSNITDVLLTNTCKLSYLSFILSKGKDNNFKYFELFLKQLRQVNAIDPIIFLMNNTYGTTDGSLYFYTFKQICQYLVQNIYNATTSTQIQILLWKELFDLSITPICKTFIIDCIAFLFNNNENCKVFYLEFLKEIITTIVNNLFFSPKDLQLNSEEENVEWKIIEVIIRPLLSKLEIDDITSIIPVNLSSINNNNNNLYDQCIAYCTCLPSILFTMYSPTLIGKEASILLNYCLKTLKNIKSMSNSPSPTTNNDTSNSIDINNNNFTLAYVLFLKHLFHLENAKKIQKKLFKEMFSILLYSKANNYFTEKYIEEAIQSITILLPLLLQQPSSEDESVLIELLNNITKYFINRSDNINITIANLLNVLMNGLSISYSNNNLKEELIDEIITIYKTLILSTSSNQQTMNYTNTLLQLIYSSIITFCTNFPNLKSTLLNNECFTTQNIYNHLTQEYIPYVNSKLQNTMEDDEVIIKKGLLNNESNQIIQNELNNLTNKRKREVQNYIVNIPKVKSKIKTITTQSIVDQVIYLKTNLNEMNSNNSTTTSGNNNNNQRDVVLRQLQPHLKEIMDMYSRLYK
ncbi:hypothetical protein ABK040_005600 [Willaertia magna]